MTHLAAKETDFHIRSWWGTKQSKVDMVIRLPETQIQTNVDVVPYVCAAGYVNRPLFANNFTVCFHHNQVSLVRVQQRVTSNNGVLFCRGRVCSLIYLTTLLCKKIKVLFSQLTQCQSNHIFIDISHRTVHFLMCTRVEGLRWNILHRYVLQPLMPTSTRVEPTAPTLFHHHCSDDWFLPHSHSLLDKYLGLYLASTYLGLPHTEPYVSLGHRMSAPPHM